MGDLDFNPVIPPSFVIEPRPTPMTSPATVYEAIVSVAGGLAKAGIRKDRKNAQQGYAFRGIDDVYNALAPLLAEHHLCILPRVLERVVTERKTNQGGALFSVTVKVAFDFVCATDGSRHQIVTYGEAMDTGDKATNKAMSAAYKYACLQAFCIPTEGDNDADAVTHTVKAREAEKPKGEHVEWDDPFELGPRPTTKRGK